MTRGGRARRHGARRRAPSTASAAERRGSVTTPWYRSGKSNTRRIAIGFIGLWLAVTLGRVVTLRLDPLLNPSAAKKAFPHPGDPFGHWIQDWTAGPHFLPARVAARLIFVSPILLGIGYELIRRGARPELAEGLERGAELAYGPLGDVVPPTRSRAPGRLVWVVLGLTVVGLAVLDGWRGTSGRTSALWIVIVYVAALNLAGWLARARRRDGAKPRPGPARTDSGTEASP